MIKNLMSLSILALMTALTMVISGCGEDSSGSKVKFKLGVIKQFDAALMRGVSAKNILVTEDNKLAYVLDSQGGLWRVDLGDKDNAHNSIHDNAKWHPLSITNDKLDDTASQAKLDKTESNPANNRRIHLAKEGVVITGWYNNSSRDYIAFIKHGEDKPSLAWINDTTHVDGTAFPVTNSLHNGKTIIAEHDNKSYVVLVVSDNPLTSVHVTSVALEKGAKIKGIHKLAGATFPIYSINVTPNLSTKLVMAAEKGSTAAKPGKLFFIDTNGVTFITLDKLGGDNDAPAVDAEAASDKWRMNTTFTTAAHPATYGTRQLAAPAIAGGVSLKSNHYEGTGTGIDNDKVKGVMLHDNKLYISLEVTDHTGDGADLNIYTGGVAVYDIAANKTTAPDQAYFGGKAGPEFKLYHDKLVIVNNDAILLVDDKGHTNTTEISKAMIEDNVYSKKEMKLGLDTPETLFMLKNRQAAPSFTRFAAIGKDVILYTSGGSAYSVHYEDKEIAVKNTSGKPSESQE